MAHELGHIDGDDLVQETFVRAWKHLSTLRDPELFGPWVSTIARRIDQAARRGQRVADEALGRLAAELASQQVEPEARAESTAVVVVRELLSALPEGPERVTIVGFYLEGRRVPELMAAQGCSKGTITARLTRFRARVKKRLAAKLLAAGDTDHLLAPDEGGR